MSLQEVNFDMWREFPFDRPHLLLRLELLPIRLPHAPDKKPWVVYFQLHAPVDPKEYTEIITFQQGVDQLPAFDIAQTETQFDILPSNDISEFSADFLAHLTRGSVDSTDGRRLHHAVSLPSSLYSSPGFIFHNIKLMNERATRGLSASPNSRSSVLHELATTSLAAISQHRPVLRFKIHLCESLELSTHFMPSLTLQPSHVLPQIESPTAC